jgi:hypothetical protein
VAAAKIRVVAAAFRIFAMPLSAHRRAHRLLAERAVRVRLTVVRLDGRVFLRSGTVRSGQTLRQLRLALVVQMRKRALAGVVDAGRLRVVWAGSELVDTPDGEPLLSRYDLQPDDELAVEEVRSRHRTDAPSEDESTA